MDSVDWFSRNVNGCYKSNLKIRVHMNVVPRSTGNTNSGTEN